MTTSDNLRPQIRELLVRDGAEVMLAVITATRSEEIAAAMANTTCGPTDLGACDEAIRELRDAWSKVEARPASTYDGLANANDPTWAVTRFTTGSVTFLR